MVSVLAPCDSQAPWGVLRVETGREQSASIHLTSREIEHYNPTYILTRKYSHWRPEAVARPIFPGYIFARFHTSQKTMVIGSPYVYDQVAFDHKPAYVEHSEIERIKLLVSTGPATPWAKLVCGDRVRVLVGRMTGMVGHLAEIRINGVGEHHFVVNVFMLGRAVSVKVDPEMLEAA